MKAWLITTKMGYGHQRAAYPLKPIAYQRIITANNDAIIDTKEQKIWRRLQTFYETISRISSIPIIGKSLFAIYDFFQSIRPLYPFRDQSLPTLHVSYMKHLIKKGLCKSLISYITQSNPNVPIITTFYLPALAADYAKYPHIYCVITDTDLHRVWVSDNPKQSNIVYFAPTERACKRLRSYGIKEENIVHTGFPLPKDLVGEHNQIIKRNLAHRLVNIDPQKVYEKTIKDQRGIFFKSNKNHPLTLTYVVGGARAQLHILYLITTSLQQKIKHEELKLQVLFGTHLKAAENFRLFCMQNHIDKQIHIQVAADVGTYFTEFSDALQTTDILISKPSEMSFYTALGIPLLILPPLGAHEEQNKEWLLHKGCGLIMDDPTTINEWLFDWLNQGIFAKAAMDGYLFAEHRGTYNIENYLKKHHK
jgi:UDP-N-acetylglucosamine:LPS N-acetylglucosamine transferase